VGSDGIAYREWSDLDLVASLVAECGDAYAELYRRHSRSVTAAVNMILVNDSRCEDVVAEVFVGLWFFPERFDSSRGSLLAFLRLKARGRSIDLVRAETARRRREDAESHANMSNEMSVDSMAIASDNALAVRDALSLLHPLEKEPIYLAFFSGLTYKEVAVQLELPEGTVKSRIRSGLSHLQTDERLVLQHENRDAEATSGAKAKDVIDNTVRINPT
jgi:RNA polymerase sigma-70 factor (ECF subfamily)